MPEPTEPIPVNEYPIKTSDKFQPQVDQEKEQLSVALKGSGINEQGITHMARNLVAQKERLRKTVERARIAEELSGIDKLTGLPNRRWMEELLTEKVAKLQRAKTGSFLLALYDLDHFKWVNDGYGHPTGDKILQSVRVMSRRKEEPIARWGGEEFMQILENTNEEGLSIAMSRHMDEIEKITGKTLEGKEFKPKEASTQKLDKMTLSVGVVRCTPEMSMDEILEKVDLALYEAKAVRNSAVMYNPESEIASYPFSPIPRVEARELVAA